MSMSKNPTPHRFPAIGTDKETIDCMNEYLDSCKDRMSLGKYKYAPVSLVMSRDAALNQYLDRKTYDFSIDWDNVAISKGFSRLDGTRGQYKKNKCWRNRLALLILKSLRL